MRNINLKRECNYLSTLIILFFIFLVGTICNFKAIQTNSGKMPVLGMDSITEHHLGYQDISEVKFYFLTDIFRVNLFNIYELFFSIGDIFLVVSYLAMLILTLHRHIQRKKEIKKIKKKKNGK